MIEIKQIDSHSQDLDLSFRQLKSFSAAFMSHFGRSGPPDIRDTYSLLVLNISFRTSADDLFPLFDRYGKVVDIFIPRDRRSGDSRGFAFIRYKHSHEAQKAIERLDGRNVDGRNISIQFAKYGREMETIQKGKITRENFHWKRSRSRSPRRSRKDDQRENDHYHGNRSNDRHDQDRHGRYERGSSRRHRSRSYSSSRSRSPDRIKADDRSREDDRRNPRRRTPDRRASPQSSRDSSPRKSSASPAPNRRSPRASVSPAKRRASPTTQNGAGRSRSRTPDSRSRSASLNSDAEDQ